MAQVTIQIKIEDGQGIQIGGVRREGLSETTLSPLDIAVLTLRAAEGILMDLNAAVQNETPKLVQAVAVPNLTPN